MSILDKLTIGVKVKSRILNKMNKIKELNDLTPLKETIKQNVQLKAQRMRRYEKRTKFYKQNSTLKQTKKIL